MLQPRIIPCLLIHKGCLYKTIKFKSPKYVGDPLNAVKIFNEKQVDELIVLDIDATVTNKDPDYKLLSILAEECRMPLCYGGGVKTPQQFERIISLGIEKVSISSASIDNPSLIHFASERVGSQSVVVVIDVRYSTVTGNYEIFTHNGMQRREIDLFDHLMNIQELGAGEIVLNSIDRDGTMIGYDYSLIDCVISKINVPLTVLGGAGSYDDIRSVISRYGLIGTSAGSVFVFKGKYKAVLIQYINK